MKYILTIVITLFSISLFASPSEVKCTLDNNIDDFITMPENVSYIMTRAGAYSLKIGSFQVHCEKSNSGDIVNLLCQLDKNSPDGYMVSIKNGYIHLTDYQTFSVMATYACKN